MKTWLFNPFVYIAGARSLVIGWGVMTVTTIIAFYSKSHFDGVIDVHTGRVAPMPVYFLEQLTDWGVTVILFYPAGLLFSKSTIRFIDVAGTLALARWPMIICAIIGFAIKVPAHGASVDDIIKQITAGTIILGLLSLAIIIWMIALMYNSFKVSCNMKGGQAIAVFIITLIVAEIAAHLTLHQIYNHFIPDL